MIAIIAGLLGIVVLIVKIAVVIYCYRVITK